LRDAVKLDHSVSDCPQDSKKRCGNGPTEAVKRAEQETVDRVLEKAEIQIEQMEGDVRDVRKDPRSQDQPPHRHVPHRRSRNPRVRDLPVVLGHLQSDQIPFMQDKGCGGRDEER